MICQPLHPPHPWSMLMVNVTNNITEVWEGEGIFLKILWL